MSEVTHEEPYKLQHLKNDRPVEEHGHCDECRFWQSLSQEAVEKSHNPRLKNRIGNHIGECRWSDPSMTIPTADGKLRLDGFWPITHESDWCGKYEPIKGKGGLSKTFSL